MSDFAAIRHVDASGGGADASDGLGRAPRVPIVALPPIASLVPTLQLDPATDEPRRARLIGVAFACLLGAAAAQTVGVGLAWWRAIHMETFPESFRLVVWTHATPGSAASMLSAVALMVTGVVLVAAPVLAGYLGWVGRPASRWWVIGALALTAATLLVTPDNWHIGVANAGWLSVPLTVAAVVMLWRPESGRHLADWAAFRQPAPVPAVPGTVRYGRLEQFR